MATGLDMKPRVDSREIDDNDPLAELTRIMGLGGHQPASLRSDPQVALEDSFSLDLERELADEDLAAPQDGDLDLEFSGAFEDELTGALQFGDDAPSVEPPSLEDELSALLDGPAAAPAVVAEAALAEDSWRHEPAPQPLPQSADPVMPEWQEDLPAHEADETLGADAAFGRFVDQEPHYDAAVETLDDIEPDFDFDELDMAPAVEDIAAQDSLETGDDYADLGQTAYDSNVPPSPEFDAYAPQADSDDPNNVDMFVKDFEKMLARTAPAPQVEAVAPDQNEIAATDDFVIPDLEFGDDHAAALAPDLEPVQAYGAAPTLHSQHASTAASAQFDEFDLDLDEEISRSLNDEASQGDAVAAAASAMAASTYRQRTIERVNADTDFEPFVDESTQMAPDYAAAPPRSRNWVPVALLAGLMVVGGGAYYALSGKASPATSANGVALVKADPDPVKVAPENPGGATVPDQDKAVYDKVAGATETGDGQDKLVSSAEEPVDIASVASDAGEDAAAADETGKSEARVDPAAQAAASEAPAAETSAVSPKKVRTFIVKPDGTLVERPTAAAAADTAAAPADPAPAAQASALAPVAESQAPAAAAEPAQPVGDAPVTDAQAAAPASQAETAAAQPAAAEAASAAEPAQAAEPEAKPAPALKVVKTKKIKAPAAAQEAAAAPAGAAPVLDERPSDQPVNIVGKTGKQKAVETQVAAADPAPAVADAAPAAAGGAYLIQIASTPSPEAAKATYAALNRKFLGVIGGRGVNIQKADVAGKGTVYRVRIPAGSKQDAANLCAQYKSSGGNCFVTK